MAETGPEKNNYSNCFSSGKEKMDKASYRSTSSIRKGGKRSRRIRLGQARVGPSTNKLKGVRQIKQNTEVTQSLTSSEL